MPVLKRVRDDEERLSSPAFQSSASSRAVSPLARRVARRYAVLEHRNPEAALYVERLIEQFLRRSP